MVSLMFIRVCIRVCVCKYMRIGICICMCERHSLFSNVNFLMRAVVGGPYLSLDCTVSNCIYRSNSLCHSD